MPSCVAWLTNSLVGGFRGPVPTQRAARIWTIAPHRQTRLHQLPSGLLWFLTQTPGRTGNANPTVKLSVSKPFPTGSIGRKVGHGGRAHKRTHTHPAPRPLLPLGLVLTASLSGNSTDTFLLRLRGASRSSNTATSYRQWSNATCDTSARTSTGYPAFPLFGFRLQPRCTAQHSGRLLPATKQATHGTATRGDVTVTCIFNLTASHCAGVKGTV